MKAALKATENMTGVHYVKHLERMADYGKGKARGEAMTDIQDYNFNDIAQLKMNDLGIRVMVDKFGEDYMDTCHKGWRESKTLEMELWQVAQVFGAYMYNGQTELPFEMRFKIRRTCEAKRIARLRAALRSWLCASGMHSWRLIGTQDGTEWNRYVELLECRRCPRRRIKRCDMTDQMTGI